MALPYGRERIAQLVRKRGKKLVLATIRFGESVLHLPLQSDALPQILLLSFETPARAV